jgi:hypothetical protein
MLRLWRFIKDRRNQQLLSWLGGGAVVVATGIWAVVTFFFAPDNKEPQAPGMTTMGPQSPNVKDTKGDVNINYGPGARPK